MIKIIVGQSMAIRRRIVRIILGLIILFMVAFAVIYMVLWKYNRNVSNPIPIQASSSTLLLPQTTALTAESILLASMATFRTKIEV